MSYIFTKINHMTITLLSGDVNREEERFLLHPIPLTSFLYANFHTLSISSFWEKKKNLHLLHKSLLVLILSLSLQMQLLWLGFDFSLYTSLFALQKHWSIRTGNGNGRRSWIELQFIYWKSAWAIFSSQISASSSFSRFYLHLSNLINLQNFPCIVVVWR